MRIKLRRLPIPSGSGIPHPAHPACRLQAMWRSKGHHRIRWGVVSNPLELKERGLAVFRLWYNGARSDSDGTDLGPVTLRLNITYSCPSIVLDHSIVINDIVCEAGTLHGRFNTSCSFYFA